MAALVLAAICMSFGIAGTVAYFTSSSDSHNVIQTAPGVHLSLAEEFAFGVMPGDTVEGDEVKNKVLVMADADSATAWVRVKVTKSIELAEGEAETPNPDVVFISFNETGDDAKWQKGATDDWWYYKGKLSAGQSTENLFDLIYFSDYDMDNKYKNAKVTVSIKAQGVQAKNNGDTVFQAKGWPAE